MTMIATAGLDKATLKAQKKAEKKARKDKESVPEGGSLGNGQELLSRKELKKLKKRKKDVGADEPGHDHERLEKKNKKSAKPAETNEDGLQQTMAAVGDRLLAGQRRPIVKSLYKESTEVAAMSISDVESWRETRRIALENCDLKPLTAFAQSGLSVEELYATRAFTAPSPIQAQCLPIALSGRDLVGIAATGSGKTLAFGLPALHHVSAQISGGVASGRKPVVLVLAPTRELALQITGVLEEAGSRIGINTVCLYGGVPKTQQAAALRAGVGIVVATPGRLEDLVESGLCALDEISYFVLDEADRMLDLGFEPHIRKIAQSIRADRQTLMFSATWPSIIRKLAADFLANPAKVTVGSQELAASHSVSQVVEVVEAASRDARLDDLLKKYHKSRSNRLIIFVLYKKEAARVESMLQRNGWNAAAVHGDISQGQRTAAVEAFKTGTVPLLVATDVAARGLDIPDVEVVINYSFPLTTEDYVHRIGRTGRAGKKGLAHTFFVGVNDKPRAGELINVLREAGQPVPDSLLAFGTAVKKKESKLYGSHFKDVDLNVKAKKVTFDSDSE